MFIFIPCIIYYVYLYHVWALETPDDPLPTKVIFTSSNSNHSGLWVYWGWLQLVTKRYTKSWRHTFAVSYSSLLSYSLSTQQWWHSNSPCAHFSLYIFLYIIWCRFKCSLVALLATALGMVHYIIGAYYPWYGFFNLCEKRPPRQQLINQPQIRRGSFYSFSVNNLFYM